MAMLLKFRVPSVQRFIFETSSLREIRGASALIEDFCNEDMAKQIEQNGGLPLYLAAGHGAVYFEDTPNEPAQMRCKKTQVTLLDYIQSASATLTPGFASIAYEPVETNGVKELLAKLDENLDQAAPAVVPLPALHSAMQSCISCQRFPGCYRHQETEDWVCHVCRLKDRRTRRQPLPYWTRFATFLESEIKDSTQPAKQAWQRLLPAKTSSQNGNWTDPFLADDLNQLGKKSSRPGYVALIYADVNNLGTFVKKQYMDLPKDVNGLQQRLSSISEKIDASMQNATYTAIIQTWPNLPQVILDFQARQPDRGQAPEEEGAGEAPLERLFPFDILYLGGDDLLFICTTDQAPNFSKNLIEAFEEQVKKLEMGLTLSIGMVFAKAHTPMSVLIEHAKQVLKSAKTKALVCTKEKSHTFQNAIDFSALTETSVLDLKAQRQQMYQGRDGQLLTRPFSKDEFDALLVSMKELDNGRIRPVRFLPVLEACRRSVTQGRIAMQALLARMTCGDRQAVLDAWQALHRNAPPPGETASSSNSIPPGNAPPPLSADPIFKLPWWGNGKDTVTPLGDWLDLAPFLEKKKEGRTS